MVFLPGRHKFFSTSMLHERPTKWLDYKICWKRSFSGRPDKKSQHNKKVRGGVVGVGALLPVVAAYWHVLNIDTTISNKSRPRRSARWNVLEEIKTSFSIQFSIERNTKEAKLTYHRHSQDAKGKKGSNICSWKLCSWIISYKSPLD